MNYHYFSKFRGIKPKIDKLTNSTQLYPSLESKMPWLLFRGDLWSRDLLSENHLYPFENAIFIRFCMADGLDGQGIQNLPLRSPSLRRTRTKHRYRTTVEPPVLSWLPRPQSLFIIFGFILSGKSARTCSLRGHSASTNRIKMDAR